MRSRTAPDLANRCPRCWLQLSFCLCAEVPRVETRTRFVVVRHALEYFKSTNTARIALLALTNAELWEYGHPEVRFDEQVLPREDTWLLFPDGAEPAPPSPPPRHLIVLDGTWSQARKMVQRIDALRGLPRFALPPTSNAPVRLKRPPHQEGRSTLEALADAVTLLEGAEAGTALHALHNLFVQRVLEIREAGGNPATAPSGRPRGPDAHRP